MTKAEIVSKVAKATGVEKATVNAVVQSFMENVKDSLAKEKPVYLRGFGSFIIKHRAKKTARNITKSLAKCFLLRLNFNYSSCYLNSK